MTQQALAEKPHFCPIKQSLNAILEPENMFPSLELAFRIADAFGVAISEAFDYEVKGE